MSDEVARCADREQLVVFARRWLYEHRLLIVHDRAIRALIATALARFEAETSASIRSVLPPDTLEQWSRMIAQPHATGVTHQSWLWAAPTRHSTRQISEVLERINWLRSLDVHKYLSALPDLIVRRFARRLASRPPSAGAKIKEPVRTVEVACFLRYCLLTATDQLILMVQRRVADLWRQAAGSVGDTANWADLYRSLLNELENMSTEGGIPDSELRAGLAALVASHQQRRPPGRASLVRERLIEAIRPVRSLLSAIAKLPWQAAGDHPVIKSLAKLRDLYARNARSLPDIVSPQLGSVWRDAISGYDRERAFRALEVATLFALRRSVRNGSVWIEHSLTFRGRERLFLPAERWQAEAKRHYARLSLPANPEDFLVPLLMRVHAGLTFEVEGLVETRCADCKHAWTTQGQDLDNMARIRAAFAGKRDEVRERDGLLRTDEISAILDELGLNRTQAAAIFGGGPNAFAKYINGEVLQSVAMDRLLRLARRVGAPAVAFLQDVRGEQSTGTVPVVGLATTITQTSFDVSSADTTPPAAGNVNNVFPITFANGYEAAKKTA
jgi:hypothetical protein